MSCLKRSSPSSSPSLSNEEIATHNLQILTNLKANDSHVKLGHYVVEGLENCKVCLESCLKSLSTNCLRLCLKLSAYETLKTQIEDYIKLYPEFRVILLSSSQLESLTGFPIRRGAIGYGKIPEMRKATSRGIICLDKINDTSNLGGIIRTASNLGYDLALSEVR
ncbi:hypothetical protein TL16_g02615 [Triparma laevis f. inornata]|uniref:tRNA/rRNA methyltransferase SpoU type domain-containing protein n=1 Tax=Triparma laevis f. inornata TaxID=1714386 RepID=A0A9W7DXJ0_9STRA|nr:hypothetical protein TL16_g02615 [Triparma laevis f. inornata]